MQDSEGEVSKAIEDITTWVAALVEAIHCGHLGAIRAMGASLFYENVVPMAADSRIRRSQFFRTTLAGGNTTLETAGLGGGAIVRKT